MKVENRTFIRTGNFLLTIVSMGPCLVKKKSKNQGEQISCIDVFYDSTEKTP